MKLDHDLFQEEKIDPGSSKVYRNPILLQQLNIVNNLIKWDII